MPNKGIESLSEILSQLKAKILDQSFVFITIDAHSTIQLNATHIFATVREEEGLTLIVEKEYRNQYSSQAAVEFSCITLEVHSSLEAVGLTAVFSTALAKHNISCNVIAGYYHDHIFVEKTKAKKALEVITDLSRNEI
jgi:hypothetical protein